MRRPPSRFRLLRPVAAAALAAAPALAIPIQGCAAPGPVGFRPIQVDMTFRNVETPAERERIERIIAGEARDGRARCEQEGTNLRCRFQVADLEALERLHPLLIYPGGAGPSRTFPNPFRSPPRRERLYNDDRPAFSVVYETAELDAELEITVRFRITPGADLYFISGGEPERQADLPEDHDGGVSLRVRLAQGQRHIYGRTVLGGVERFIRVDVFSQSVERISRSEYPAS